MPPESAIKTPPTLSHNPPPPNAGSIFHCDRIEADDGMRLSLLGLFLPAAIIIGAQSQLRCPSSRRIKPCTCITVNPATGLVVVSCSNIRSWALVKYGLRPFRRRKAYQIVRLTIERIPNRTSDARSLQRIFRWLTIGELIIRNAPFGMATKIPNSIFKNTTIFALTIDGCGIKEIPGNAFGNVQHLQELMLPNNEINHISNNFASTQNELLKIDLSRNNLSSIPQHLLRKSSKLQALYLRGNRIATVEENDLVTSQSLLILDLSVNFIERIHPNAFNSLYRLDFLSLAFNPLDEEDSESLKNLGKNCQLKTVDVSGTRMRLNSVIGHKLTTLVAQEHRAMDESEFCCLSSATKLTHLDLVGSQLNTTSIRSCGVVFPSVKQLDISRTGMNTAVLRYFPNTEKIYAYRMRTVRYLGPYEFRNNRKLHTIELVFGVLRRIDKSAFRGVENSLSVLSLSYNRLRRLPEDSLAKLERLAKLDLSFNMFTDNSENESYPLNQALIRRSDWSLQELNLAGNRLLTVPQRLIAPLRNLRILNLAGNSIRNLMPDDFLANPLLQHLNLQGNRIEYIDPKVFNPLAKLKHLNLAANSLSQLSSALHLPASLETINLSHNSIASLDHVQMSHLTRLKTINLSSNDIRTPSVEFLAGSKESLVFIDLNDNRLDCSCSLRPFIEWLSENKVTLSANTRCYYPEALRGQSLIDQVCWSRCEDDRRQSINFCA